MKVPYSDQTLNHKNPIARFAHRHRHQKSIFLATSLLRSKSNTVVDYGCGQGMFVNELNSLGYNSAFGYEPFMAQIGGNPNVFKSINDIPSSCIDLITLFETIEHLSRDELSLFFSFCRQCLSKDGRILISAPIEIGPAIFVKDFARSFLFRRPLEYSPLELLKCGLFGMSVHRSKNIKGSHKDMILENQFHLLMLILEPLRF